MYTFLEDTLNRIKKKHTKLSELTIILPSKRAGGFLKNYLRTTSEETAFAPHIISIEEFIEELSDLTLVDPTELIFKSYEAYLATTHIKEKESFESFSGWITTLLNDINEVDRYLVDPNSFFNYLGSIKTMDRWNVQGESTEMIQNYLRFWEGLYPYYQSLKEQLKKEGIGYQGLLYREAAENIEHYISANRIKKHIFIGFNALNTAEQHIIQELLEADHTDVYWDVEHTFFNDPQHGAALFVRRYFEEWKYYKSNTPQFITDNYSTPKQIDLVATQSNISQAKYIGESLSRLSPDELSRTAIVLADETLLIPVINSLPENIKTLNITMGVGLKHVPLATFFEQLLQLHNTASQILYYKNVVTLLQHPAAAMLLKDAPAIITHIVQNNTTHFELDQLLKFSNVEDATNLEWLFGPWNQSGTIALTRCEQLLQKLKAITTSEIETIALFELHRIFQKIQSLDTRFKQLSSLRSVQQLYLEIVGSTSLDFQGDAYDGLQLMGVLETRVLDFDRIIMTSVNEGVLPTGKSNASFITYDLKREFKLPLYVEKDAIYTYHFYHILHRATQVSLLYTNLSEGLNSGEKSRFLLQLELEKHDQHTLSHSHISPSIIIQDNPLKTIQKTEAVMVRLQEIATKGFSPSALTSYIRNPIDFYFQKILRIKEMEEVEETVAANTLGTIVHDTLEHFYKPIETHFLSMEYLDQIEPQIHDIVTDQFKKTFKEGTFSKGKNLIIFEVAKRYISNFIAAERKALKAGNKIKIVSIEAQLKAPIEIPELNFDVNIGGKVDRVDEYNGQLRIIDYKTGMVSQGELELIAWEDLIHDYKKSKAFQVLAYATMLATLMPIQGAEAGVVSFKNLGSGFLKFGTKAQARSKEKNQEVTSETITLFKEQLAQLILEICNPSIPFTEKEIT